jgi:hypothetical protein
MERRELMETMELLVHRAILEREVSVSSASVSRLL